VTNRPSGGPAPRDWLSLTACCLLEPLCAFLLFSPLRIFWEAVEPRRGPQRRTKEQVVRGAIKDLDNALVAIGSLGTALLFGIALGVGVLLDHFSGVAFESPTLALLSLPAIVLASHGVGWCIGEALTGHSASRSAAAQPRALLRVVVPHGVIGWVVVALILYFAQR